MGREEWDLRFRRYSRRVVRVRGWNNGDVGCVAGCVGCDNVVVVGIVERGVDDDSIGPLSQLHGVGSRNSLRFVLVA